MPVEKFKTERCKVLAYNKETKELDVNFLEYGIRLHDIESVDDNTISIKYKGEIGTPNFICKI